MSKDQVLAAIKHVLENGCDVGRVGDGCSHDHVADALGIYTILVVRGWLHAH